MRSLLQNGRLEDVELLAYNKMLHVRTGDPDLDDGRPYKQRPTNGPSLLKPGRLPPKVDTSAASE